jgi:hypothetical protein
MITMEKTKIALEDDISRTIMAENGCTAHFQYEDDKNVNMKGCENKPCPRIITVMTYNPKTGETFLLKEVCAKSDIEGLEEVLKYTKSHKKDYDTFSVVWVKRGEGKTQTSYFYCVDLLEAIEKFYYGKNREEYVVYKTEMSPKS